LYGEPLAEELSLFLISINVVASILCQVDELLGVLIDRVVSLSEIQEL
jgi:hypothetical protein